MRTEPARDFAVRIVSWAQEESSLRAVRLAVFVVEQGIAEELEWDEHDGVSEHALLSDRAGEAIGCGRLLPDGHIGRVAVLRARRGQGAGAAIVARLVELAREHGHRRVLLHSQVQAMPFYARLGFAPVGEVFVEAGIPHRTMARGLSA